MDRKKLSIIIVNYNSLTYLQNCISSIEKFNDIGDQLEVIVVDNSTGDESIRWLQGQQNIIAIANENRGFGQGNNVGVKKAHGEYLLFLNPDTVIIEPVFQFAVDQFEKDPKLGLFGVQLVDGNLRPNSTYGLRMPLGFTRSVLTRILISAKVFIPSAMYTSGADLFIRKSVFDEAGAFDENLFMYCEEADLCNRVNRLGYRNAFYSEKKIIHLEGKTQDAKLFTSYRRQMESRKYYCEKYSIDFLRFARKEKRYCALKKTVFSMKGDKARAAEYQKIVQYLDSLTQ